MPFAIPDRHGAEGGGSGGETPPIQQAAPPAVAFRSVFGV